LNIESNVMPGVPFDVMPKLYAHIFKDWYGRGVNSSSQKVLDELASRLEDKTVQSNPLRFDIQFFN